jgi:hypothetical protein
MAPPPQRNRHKTQRAHQIGNSVANNLISAAYNGFPPEKNREGAMPADPNGVACTYLKL